MSYLLRGALIEYGSDFLGPIPNVILFQFNPESLVRTIEVPQRPSGVSSRENSQVGDIPVEKISFTAHFSAADRLKDNNVMARGFGIGTQLAALEKLVYPAGDLSKLVGKAIDAIGSAILGDGGSQTAVQAIPRESYPRLLFVWGLSRVLPVMVESMTITEQEYDFLLNPVRAEVQLSLAVLSMDCCSEDKIAKGALKFSNVAKEAQAALNLANTVTQVVELIPF